MKVREIAQILYAQVYSGEDDLDLDVRSACGADLMSDVMAFVKESVVLLTGLVNPQVVRTADLMDIRAIVFVRGKVPTAEMIELAKSLGIIMLSTKYSMFVACGKLYEAGLRGSGTRTIA
jgi:predicted transcriptional regulator